jgi:hypothetical protein
MPRRALLSLLGAATLVLRARPALADQPKPRTIQRPSEALKKLLAEFKRVPGIAADFEEKKHIALLKTPLESSGKVYFHPPQSLARLVEKPRPSHLVISGRRIVVKEDGVRREVDLSDKPALRALINSLLHVLSGNREQLLRDYEAQFEGTSDTTWKLVLLPRNNDLKNLVQSFTFEGDSLVLSRLRVLEASGDETVTKFSNVDTARKFSTEEIARFFDI